MAITKIKVPAHWRSASGQDLDATAEFTLGLGPCGKVVTHLDLEIGGDSAFIMVVQVHADGSQKGFYYRIADLIGRVECETD
jgi:hypothetical protein